MGPGLSTLCSAAVETCGYSFSFLAYCIPSVSFLNLFVFMTFGIFTGRSGSPL